ncbi:hypothetical protein J437_LFUL002881, partial [Ladona fulva]
MWRENTCSPSAKKKLKTEAIEIDATSIQPSTATKCFLKAGFPGDQDPKTFVVENDDELFIEIQELVAKLMCDMSTEEYLCVDQGLSTANVDIDIDSILESTMSTKHNELCEDTEEEMERSASFYEKGSSFSAAEGISIPLRSVHERVVAATGVSKRTLKCISKEGKDICDGLSQSFMSPRKSKPQKCSKSTVDDFDVQ